MSRKLRHDAFFLRILLFLSLTLICEARFALAGDVQTTASLPIVQADQIGADYDVVVAGAGTGGSMAAVQAARLGARVLLVEETDWIGGQMTAAAVSSMDEAGDRVRKRGLYREFTGRVSRHYAKLGLSTDTCAITENHFAMEPRVARSILLDMLAEAHSPTGKGEVDLLLLSRVTAVMREGNRVTGVELVTESHDESSRNTSTRKLKVTCRVLVDATELGSVLPLTGARYRLGNKVAGGDNADVREIATGSAIQDFTWTAVIKAYPEGAPQELILRTSPPNYNREHFRMALNNPLPTTSTKPWSWQRFIDYRGMPDSSRPDPAVRNPWAKVTRTHMNIAANDVEMNALDLADPERYLHKEYELKSKTLGLLYYIHNDMDAPMTTWTVAIDEGYDTPFNRHQNARLVKKYPELTPFLPVLNHFPPMVYARESRRLVGLTTMRGSDIDRRYGSRHTSHTVAVGDYPVDLHGTLRPEDLELELDRPEDLSAIGFSPDRMGPFPVPFEAFIPEKIDGLLAAEKNISQSRLVNGATRLQPITMLTGQAAGAIAGLAIRQGVQPRQVNPITVQSVLLEAGDVLVARRDGLEYFPGVEQDTPLWRDVQLALLYGALIPEDAGGWRSEWSLELGEAGPRGWDTRKENGITFRGKVGVALLRHPAGSGADNSSATTSTTDGIVRMTFRAARTGNVGVVGRMNDLNHFESARVHQGRLEILRWEGTSSTVVASSPALLKTGTTVVLSLKMEGPHLAAQLENERGRTIASCEAVTSAAAISGSVGMRISSAEPVEIVRFDLLTLSGQALASSTFPHVVCFADARLTQDRVTQLRHQFAGTKAASVLERKELPTLAEWTRTFAEWK